MYKSRRTVNLIYNGHGRNPQATTGALSDAEVASDWLKSPKTDKLGPLSGGKPRDFQVVLIT